MKENELITVIVPVYNVKQYLDKCVLSIINQTYNNLEIIIVDDGSTDGSSEICELYKEKDNRIIVIHKANGGLSSARNAALDIIKGRYICFIDSDDWVDLDYVETLYRKTIENHVRICSYGYDKIKSRVISKDKALYYYLKHNKYFQESVCHHMFDVDLFDNLRFLEGKIHEDSFISYQLLEKVDKIAYITYLGYHVTKRNDSITRSQFNNKNYDRVEACREIYEYYKDTKFNKLAYQKYIGSLIWFIIKTNSIKCEKNIIAINEFTNIIKRKGIKDLKIKYIPFVILNNFNFLCKVKM